MKMPNARSQSKAWQSLNPSPPREPHSLPLTNADTLGLELLARDNVCCLRHSVGHFATAALQPAIMGIQVGQLLSAYQRPRWALDHPDGPNHSWWSDWKEHGAWLQSSWVVVLGVAFSGFRGRVRRLTGP